MVYRRGNGFHPFVQWRDEMDRLANTFFGPTASRAISQPQVAGGYPPLNVWEDGDSVFAEAELPGLKSEDIHISVVGAELTIRGRRGGEAQQGVAYLRQERGVGEFHRAVHLPVEVNAEKVEASLSNGVLLLKLPKAESAKPKKIKVSPGN